jgi:hypothetical protein
VRESFIFYSLHLSSVTKNLNTVFVFFTSISLQLSTWLERRELMDLVVLKPLMVNRGVHRLNNKLL